MLINFQNLSHQHLLLHLRLLTLLHIEQKDQLLVNQCQILLHLHLRLFVQLGLKLVDFADQVLQVRIHELGVIENCKNLGLVEKQVRWLPEGERKSLRRDEKMIVQFA
jgi:hypothetical protein